MLRHYIAEHLTKRNLQQNQLAEMLGCDENTVSRWINYKVRATPEVLAAIAEALGGDQMEWEDLLHHPDKPSPNQLMRKLPAEDQEFVLRTINGLIKQAS